MDPKTTDPVIIDLLKWLKENLPPDVNEEDIFKNVRRVQKVFDTLIALSFEEFYKHALSAHPADTDTLEATVNSKLQEMKEYHILNQEKQLRTKKLELSREKLDLKKEQHKLITSIRFDGCMDLISRYNHLMSKK